MNNDVCCFCGKPMNEWRNSAWPVRPDEVCCERCNYYCVLPKREVKLKYNKARQQS